MQEMILPGATLSTRCKSLFTCHYPINLEMMALDSEKKCLVQCRCLMKEIRESTTKLNHFLWLITNLLAFKDEIQIEHHLT